MSQLDQKKITVSIIEDSDIHRTLFSEKLSESGKFFVVAQDKLGRAGVESVKKYQPRIVLLDFQLPDITGIEVSKRIKSHFNDIKILAITAHTEKSIVEKIIHDKNVDGVAIKGSHYFQNAFLDVVESVVNGESYIDPSLLKTLRLSKDVDVLAQLTKREFEVFMQVSVGKTDEEIAKDLSVDILHVKNTRSKIVKKTNHTHTKSVSQKISGNT